MQTKRKIISLLYRGDIFLLNATSFADIGGRLDVFDFSANGLDLALPRRLSLNYNKFTYFIHLIYSFFNLSFATTFAAAFLNQNRHTL